MCDGQLYTFLKEPNTECLAKWLHHLEIWILKLSNVQAFEMKMLIEYSVRSNQVRAHFRRRVGSLFLPTKWLLLDSELKYGSLYIGFYSLE